MYIFLNIVDFEISALIALEEDYWMMEEKACLLIILEKA